MKFEAIPRLRVALGTLVIALTATSAGAHWEKSFSPPNYDPYAACDGAPMAWQIYQNGNGGAWLHSIPQIHSHCHAQETGHPHGDIWGYWESQWVAMGQAYCYAAPYRAAALHRPNG